MCCDIIILGLGKTGLSCADYFSRQGLDFSVMDTRLEPPGMDSFRTRYPQIVLYTGGFSSVRLAQAKTLVLSPGIPRNHPAILQARAMNPALEIIGDIELFARFYQGPLVAITGSNGKSTVTSLVGEMAKASGISAGVGGNLGTPVLNLSIKDYALYVLELSSFQLESTESLKPSVATILNLSPDHFDRYASMQEYTAAKERIFMNASKIVLNRDDPLVMQGGRGETVEHSLSFGLSRPQKKHYGLIEEDKRVWLAKGSQKLLALSDLKLLGYHNVANALAALALAESIGLDVDSNVQALETFRGLPHRSEWIRTYHGVPVINDSKGTNVGATLATLQGLAKSISGKWVLIAGGVGKNADFMPMIACIKKYCRALVLIGEAAEHLETLFGLIVPCFRAKNMEEAVIQAFKQVQSGDGVLLSPMCASLDMFQNFEERGEVFRAIVWDFAG